MAVVFGSVFSALAVSQLLGRADSVKNYMSAEATHKEAFTQPSWDMRYKSGSFKLKEGQWLKTKFVPAQIAPQTAPNATVSVDQLREALGTYASIFSFTPNELRAVYFDPKAEKSSDIMQRMPRSGCHYAETRMPKSDPVLSPQAFAAWKAFPGSFSRALERLNRRRPVRLIWTDRNTENEVVMMVNTCDYASFLANLRQFAGQRWHEVRHELSR